MSRTQLSSVWLFITRSSNRLQVVAHLPSNALSTVAGVKKQSEGVSAIRLHFSSLSLVVDRLFVDMLMLRMALACAFGVAAFFCLTGGVSLSDFQLVFCESIVATSHVFWFPLQDIEVFAMVIYHHEIHQAVVECSLIATINRAQSLDAMFVQYVCRCSSINVHAVDVVTRCIYLDGKVASTLRLSAVKMVSALSLGASFLPPLLCLSFPSLMFFTSIRSPRVSSGVRIGGGLGKFAPSVASISFGVIDSGVYFVTVLFELAFSSVAAAAFYLDEGPLCVSSIHQSALRRRLWTPLGAVSPWQARQEVANAPRKLRRPFGDAMTGLFFSSASSRYLFLDFQCPVSASSLSEESSEDELTLLRRLRRLSSESELGGLSLGEAFGQAAVGHRDAPAYHGR
ncbi:hypothetical protein Tco_1210063 [Tanacetum coccineum]